MRSSSAADRTGASIRSSTKGTLKKSGRISTKQALAVKDYGGNCILEYWDRIQDGSEVVGARIRLQYQKLVADLEKPREPWGFDLEKANRPIEYIETYCRHSKGRWAGKPVKLELWQKAIIQAAFGFVNKYTGHRKYRRVDVFIGRKNGKSLLGSGIGLYLLTSDGEGGAEIYSIATKKDQARIIWLEAKRMVQQDPVLRSMVDRRIGEMRYERAFSVFKPLASNTDTLDGVNASGVLVDELHAIKDMELLPVMIDSMSARTQPMLWVFTTMGTVRASAFDDTYDYDVKVLEGQFTDEHLLAFIYELDSAKDWLDESKWRMSNPNLGVSKDIDNLRAKVEKAKNNPTDVRNLQTKDFNVRETSSGAWLTFDAIQNTALFDPKLMGFSYGIGGVDLSETTDLTAAKMLCMRRDDPRIYALQMYWMPAELIEERTKADKVPYDLWHERGLLRLSPGHKVDHELVTKWFLELRDEYGIYMPWCGYDSWSAQYWVKDMVAYFGKECMVPVIQGKKTLSSPMKRLGRDLEAKLIVYNNHPIDIWCMTNTHVDLDEKNGTIQPAKGRNLRQRIDGLSALLDAYVVLESQRETYLNML